MDEHWVEKTDRLFLGQQVLAAFSYRKGEIDELIAKASDEDVLEAEVDQWARGLGADHEMEAPSVDVESETLVNLGRVEVDCTDAPGISMTTTELYGGNVRRPGYRFESRIAVAGDANLLRSDVPGAHPLLATITSGQIVRVWEWPDVLGPDAFQREVGEYKAMLDRSVEAVAAAVERENGTLAEHARKTIEARREEILKEREFLGKLTIPVTRVDDEPQEFGPPPIVRVETPARAIDSAEPDAQGRVGEPQLDEFYDHIISLVRAVGRGMERTPDSFSAAGEETLRDHFLLALNTHYRGATYAEAFNKGGKTDILIRVHDQNVFIGECKWWGGPKALEEALAQLFGYTTWRDTRVALIFFVPTKEITKTIASAHNSFEQRPEFLEWLPHEEGELACRMRWPDDAERVATLTALFVHLPRS
jgi:hypothetical protein